MLSSRTHRIIALGLVGAVLATAAAADIVDDRVAAMKRVRNSYRTLVLMARSGPFDLATAHQEAGIILAALQGFKDLFPPGSASGDEAARREIWTDRAGFEAAWRAGEAAAGTLAKAPDADSSATALNALGAACKGCHEKFVNQKD